MTDQWTITAPRDVVAQSVGRLAWSVTGSRWGEVLPEEVAALVAPPIVVRAAPGHGPDVAG